MRHTVADVARSVTCVLSTRMRCTKTDEPIVKRFGLHTYNGLWPKEACIRRGYRSYTRKSTFGGYPAN